MTKIKFNIVELHYMSRSVSLAVTNDILPKAQELAKAEHPALASLYAQMLAFTKLQMSINEAILNNGEVIDKSYHSIKYMTDFSSNEKYFELMKEKVMPAVIFFNVLSAAVKLDLLEFISFLAKSFDGYDMNITDDFLVDYGKCLESVLSNIQPLGDASCWN